jgi:hypothetical protein
MAEKAKWTVLTYIAAHNNLDQMGKRSLMEILKVGSTKDVVHGVLYDGHQGAGRYVMGDPGTVRQQQQLGGVDSGDPQALVDTATWLFSQCPAERYGIVLWSHGTGWEPSEIQNVAKQARPQAEEAAGEARERAAAPGSRALFRSTLRAMLAPAKPTERAILFDDGTGHSLDTLELARVVQTIGESVGQPLDLLGMDACLMANLEVAYELRHVAKHLVASEELVPGHSWPYQEIYGTLAQSPAQDGAAMARLIVERYVSFFRSNPPGAGDVTKAALDLSKIEGPSEAVSALAAALSADMERSAELLWTTQHETRQRETRQGARKPSKFDYHLWDLGSLATALAASRDASDSVRQAASAVASSLGPDGAVLAAGHQGAWFDGTCGVSVYMMPPGQQRIAPSYSQLAFAKDTGWDKMLAAYHAGV